MTTLKRRQRVRIHEHLLFGRFGTTESEARSMASKVTVLIEGSGWRVTLPAYVLEPVDENGNTLEK